MRQRGIPDHVREFIKQHLNSVAQLEILLLVHDNPSTAHHPERVGERLRIDPGWAAQELERLTGQGLLSRSSDVAGAYCFDPASEDDRRAVDGLATAFSTHRVSVITLIFSTPSDSIGSFADAFKLRSDDDDG